MKFRFTPEHFLDCYDNCHSVAKRANALLEAEEAKCEKVYRNIHEDSDCWWASSSTGGDTHQALLWNVEEIEEEK